MHHPISRNVLVFLVGPALVLFSSSAQAQVTHPPCESPSYPDLTNLNLLAREYRFYTVCYDPAFFDDVNLVSRWIDQALMIGRDKYGVMQPTRHTAVFLPPVPTSSTRSGVVRSTCCRKIGNVIRAEIHYLTPSAWNDPPLGALGYEDPAEYHAQRVVREIMMNVIQYSLSLDGVKYWIREGVAEYDAYFHTTPWNRTVAVNRLIDQVDRYHRGKIYCCQTLEGSSFMTTSGRYGAAVIMTFLAEQYGESIHLQLLISSLEDVLAERAVTVESTFDDFKIWFDRHTGRDEPDSTRTKPDQRILSCSALRRALGRLATSSALAESVRWQLLEQGCRHLLEREKVLQ